MICRKSQALFPVLMMLICIGLGSGALGFPQQGETPEQPQVEKAVEEAGEIVPAPQDIKQATGIYVFIGWIWLSIAVLIFFLRLKIKEADRLYSLDFFSDEKK